jgi:hypothetical protein
MTLGTCARCPAQAVRTLGMAALCGDCVERILAPIRARVLERDGPHFIPATVTGGGIGRQAGPLRLDYGPSGWADLCCDQCGATWTGRIDTACPWCDDANTRMWDGQRIKTLTPPDVDPDDRVYPQVLIGWGERLNRAIEAGLVSVEEASNAYRKAVGRERAA